MGSMLHHFEGRLREGPPLEVDGVRPREAGPRDTEHDGGAGGAAQQRHHLVPRQRLRGVPVCEQKQPRSISRSHARRASKCRAQLSGNFSG